MMPHVLSLTGPVCTTEGHYAGENSNTPDAVALLIVTRVGHAAVCSTDCNTGGATFDISRLVAEAP